MVLQLPSPAQAPAHSDVLVIGAGFAGLAAALTLAEAGAAVTVVERSATIDPGDGDVLGFVELGVVEHPQRTRRALGEARWQELRAFARRGRDWLDARGWLVPSGLLWASLEGREAEALAESAAVLGLETWTAEQVRRWSGLRLGTGLWLPEEGVTTEGAREALAEEARAAGVVIVGGAPAVALADGVGVEVAGRRLDAEMLVLAAGAGTGALAPVLGPRLTPIREQGLRVDLEGRPVRRAGRAGQGYTRWRAMADGSVVVSGARWATPHMEVGEWEPVVEPRVQARLESFVGERMGPFQVRERWAWLCAQTPDQLPLIGPLPGDTTRVVAAGFGVGPVAMSVAGGLSVACGLLHGTARVPHGLRSQRLVRWNRD